MKHYGIKNIESSEWLRNDSNMIFWTTSKHVAQEQLKICYFLVKSHEVAEFKDENE